MHGQGAMGTRSGRPNKYPILTEGAWMSDAEASGYLLIAGGLIWVAIGIAGLAWVKRRGHEPEGASVDAAP